MLAHFAIGSGIASNSLQSENAFRKRRFWGHFKLLKVERRFPRIFTNIVCSCNSDVSIKEFNWFFNTPVAVRQTLANRLEHGLCANKIAAFEFLHWMVKIVCVN